MQINLAEYREYFDIVDFGKINIKPNTPKEIEKLIRDRFEAVQVYNRDMNRLMKQEN